MALDRREQRYRRPAAPAPRGGVADSSAVIHPRQRMTTLAVMPAIGVEINDAPVPLPLLRSLKEVLVLQELSAPALCELVFHGPDGVASNDSLRLGSSLRLSVDNSADALFDG